MELGAVPDFVKAAEAFEVQGVRVGSPKEFLKTVKTAMKNDVTTVIDIPISSEENVFPMVPPGAEIKKTITG